MNRYEILNTTYGELMDMIACYDIDHGLAIPKQTFTFDEAMALN